MNCPKCTVNMEKSYRQGIELNYCPNCSGEWLEKGVLNKMMERFSLSLDKSNFNPHNNMSDNFDGKRGNYVHNSIFK